MCVFVFIRQGMGELFYGEKSDTYERFAPIGDVEMLGYCCREEYIHFKFFIFFLQLGDGIAT